MRVVLVNRDHRLWEGGDRRKIEQYLRHLQKLGVDAFYTPNLFGDYGADLVHLFHVSYPTSAAAFANIRRQNLPFVASTIYSGSQVPVRVQQSIVDAAALLIVHGPGELAFLRRRLYIDPHKVRTIRNGVNRMFAVPPTLGSYVLNVGRISPQKNQLALAEACRDLGLALVCVGDVMNVAYASEVTARGATLLPNRPQESLPPLYQGARVLACVSWHEVQPNTVLEGGLAGLNIVLTNRSCSFTEGLPGIWVCAPKRESIRDALADAWVAPRTTHLRDMFSTWTWDDAVTSLVDVYESALTGSRSPFVSVG